MAAARREKEDDDFVARKLHIHLDYWDADKWQLENRLVVGERTHKRNQAYQSYENARLALTLGLEQHHLFLVKLKMESALDDLANARTLETLLDSQLRLAKGKVEQLQQQLVHGRSLLGTKEAEFTSKNASQERVIQELRQQVEQMKLDHAAEMAKAKTNTEQCKSKASKQLEAILRERDFVWNQLKYSEVRFCSRLKEREDEIGKLRDSSAYREVELRKAESDRLAAMPENGDVVTGNELRHAYRRLDEVRQENENLKELYAQLEAKYEGKQRAVKNPRKDMTTRNLSPELEAAAEAPGPARRLRSRKAKAEVDKATGKRSRGENAGKRRQKTASRQRVLGPRDEPGNSGSAATSTSFFSASFSIPKVKSGLAAVR